MGHRIRPASRRPVRAWLTIVICISISLWLALNMPARAAEPVCRLELPVLGVARETGMPPIGPSEDTARYPARPEAAEVERRGFQVVQNNRHFVIFCNSLPIRRVRAEDGLSKARH